MMMNALALTFIGIGVFILLILLYIGVFSSIHIKACKPSIPVGGHYFYKFYQTHYGDARQAFRSIDKLPLKKSFQRMGIYYDDPKKVDKEKTRFTAGIIMAGADVSEELTATMENVGYQHIQLPDIDYAITTSFPLRSIVSILVAITRVYPKLQAFEQKERLHGHPCMEYYSCSGVMHFVIPLEKNDEFYVPETLITPVD